MKAILPYFVSHAGCPNHCVFCDQKTIAGTHDQGLEGLDALIKNFECLRKPNQAYELAFFGGSFTSLPEGLRLAYLKRAKSLIDRGLIASFRVSARPDAMTQAHIDALIDHGCDLVELGVQSLNDAVLQQSERNMTVKVIKEASIRLKKSGLKLGHQLMMGLPGDTETLWQETVLGSIALGPDTVRLYPTQVLKGTQLATLYTSGKYQPLDLDQVIQQAAFAMRAFAKANVTIIKVGLQANEDLMDPNKRIAGPYHPAFRELVEGVLIQGVLKDHIDNHAKGQQVTLTCHPKEVSKVVGVHKSNLKWYQTTCLGRLNLQQDQGIRAHHIRLESGGHQQVVNWLTGEPQIEV